MAIAILALIAALVALYLHLFKLGKVGSLSCGSGSGGCTIAQFSQYGWFLGVDVALIGTIGYSVLTAVALLGLQPRFADSRRITNTLLGLIVAAVLFTIRLKFGEWVVLRTFCIWCFESFVTIWLCLALALLDRRRINPPTGGAVPA